MYTVNTMTFSNRTTKKKQRQFTWCTLSFEPCASYGGQDSSHIKSWARPLFKCNKHVSIASNVNCGFWKNQHAACYTIYNILIKHNFKFNIHKSCTSQKINHSLNKLCSKGAPKLGSIPAQCPSCSSLPPANSATWIGHEISHFQLLLEIDGFDGICYVYQMKRGSNEFQKNLQE